MSWTEILGAATGAASVWLAARENVWNWPIGLANSAFFLVLFLEVGLFANSGLQVVYIALGFYGWYRWLRGGEGDSGLSVTRAGRRLSISTLVFVLIATPLLALLLERSAGSTAPVWDALTTVLSLAAMYLMALKKIENWGIWITADVIYIVLYATTGLYLTSALYVVFLLMCIAGLRNWATSLDEPALMPAESVA